MRSRHKLNFKILSSLAEDSWTPILIYRHRLPPLKPHEYLITWSIWSQVTIWKSNFFFFTIPTTNKVGRVLSLWEGLSHKILSRHKLLVSDWDFPYREISAWSKKMKRNFNKLDKKKEKEKKEISNLRLPFWDILLL